MIIAEQFVKGKRDDNSCEDGIVVTNDFVAVIDGSTSKGKRRVNPLISNGKYCMEAIASYIKKMPADVGLYDFCSGVTETIHNIYVDYGIVKPEDNMPIAPVDRMTASAVIYSRVRKQVWMIGDCQCLVKGKLHTNAKPSEQEIASKRAMLFRQQADDHPDMIANGNLMHDYARDAILMDLVASMDGENHTYAVIDGYPIYRDGIKVIDLTDACEDADIVLASDGYPFLCPTLEKSERKLRKQLSSDPFNIDIFKATKGLMAGCSSYDDRAYIRFNPAPVQRYFLTLSFDGTDYHGWQIQPNGMSVQERLQDALSKILRRPIEVTGAGRTDAGVHARTMVCHYDDIANRNCTQVLYRLNQLLPRDIACSNSKPVDNNLHARFSATKRIYHYFIHTRKDPFNQRFSVETHYTLDFDLMNKAADMLTKITDFKAFCKSDNDSRTTICHVGVAHWVQQSPTRWYFEISADRFLRNMVRAVVGTLFDVGRHRTTLAEFREVIMNGNRSDSGESMPAKGLFLWDVEY